MAEITTGAGEPEGRPDATDPLPPGPQGPGAWQDAPPAAPRTAAATAAWGRHGAVQGAGLVVAGLLVGALAMTAARGGPTPVVTGTSSAAGQGSTGQGGTALGAAPQDGTGQDGLGGGGPGALPGAGRGGGVAGETRVVGTVTAVGAGSVTVRAADGTSATCAVDADTEVAKAGAAVALSTVQAGDQVLVHVLPGGVAERVLVGTPARSPGAPGGGTTGTTGGAAATTT